MYCIYCGASLPDTARFCARCGRLLSPPSGAAPPPPRQPAPPVLEDRPEERGDVLPSNVDQFTQPEEASPYHTYPAAPPDPSVTASYGHAWTQLKQLFLPLILVGLVYVAIEITATVVGAAVQNVLGEDVGTLYSVAWNVLLSLHLGAGMSYAYLRAARGERPDVEDLFAALRRCYAPLIGASVLYFLAVLVGTLLLIVPGIIVGIRLSFYPWLLVDERCGAVEALQESWRRTSGFGWTILGVNLLSIPILLLGVLLLLVGIIPAVLWTELASASLYFAVSARQAETY